MKKSDIISIILVAMIGTFASWFVVNLIMGNPDEAKASFKDIEVVTADLAEPNPEVFNADAINPTIEVYVGDCEDVDQDGMLSQAELVACGRADSLDNSGNIEGEEESEEKEDEENSAEEVKVVVEEETDTKSGNSVNNSTSTNSNSNSNSDSTTNTERANNGTTNSRNTR